MPAAGMKTTRSMLSCRTDPVINSRHCMYRWAHHQMAVQPAAPSIRCRLRCQSLTSPSGGLELPDGMASFDGMASLARVLRATRSELQSMIAQQPQISHYEPQVLEATVEALVDSLQLERVQVLSLLKQQPLYLVQPHLARERLLAYPAVLDVPLQDVIRALRRCPAALALAPDVLQQRLAAFSHALALGECEVAAALLAQPALLQHEPQQLQAHLERLQALLHFQPLAAQRLALQLPAALELSSRSVSARLAALQQSLEASPQEAVAVAVACPNLLLLGPRQLEARVQQAASTFASLLGSGRALRMLVARGDLLGLPASVLHNKWQLLEGLCRASPPWWQELLAMHPEQVAALVAAEYRSAARLRFLADMSRQAECGVAQALLTDEDEFAARFQDYKQWLVS